MEWQKKPAACCAAGVTAGAIAAEGDQEQHSTMPEQTTFDQKTLPWKTERDTALKSLHSHKLPMLGLFMGLWRNYFKIALQGKIKAALQAEEAAAEPGFLEASAHESWQEQGRTGHLPPTWARAVHTFCPASQPKEQQG